jgi:enoyl-CoA hydratase/carnithine racemase
MGRAFCAGADIGERQLKWAEELRSKPRRVIPEYRPERNPDIQYLMRDLPQIAIASVNGPAIGFGNCLQVVCDLRIASDEATFGHQFVRMGLTPGIGSTWKLPRVVGLAKAAEMMFTAKIYNAKEAKEMGLVNWVVPHDKLQEETDKLAKLIAGHPPVALRAAKLLLSYTLENDLATQVLLERWAALTHETDDHLEAVKAFLEKRNPNFTGK